MYREKKDIVKGYADSDIKLIESEYEIIYNGTDFPSLMLVKKKPCDVEMMIKCGTLRKL